MHALTQLLFAHRRDRTPITEVPAELHPSDMAAAYRIQAELVDAFASADGAQPIGYKVALTSATAQQLVGHDAPVFGTMVSTSFWAGPAELGAADFTTRIVETEFGFRIGRDVPAGAYTRDRIAPYVDAVIPSIELVDHRFAALDAAPATVLTADNAIHGGWVIGEPVTGWPIDGLDTHAVALRVDGDEVLTGSGDRVMGHPLEVLAWLATELPRHGRRLRAGDYVTTGLATDGIHDAAPGQTVVADFGALGRVSATFT